MTTLNLTNVPIPGSHHVYVNGIEAREGVDWVEAGGVLSMLAAADVRSGDLIECLYAHGGEQSTISGWVMQDPPFPIPGLFDPYAGGDSNWRGVGSMLVTFSGTNPEYGGIIDPDWLVNINAQPDPGYENQSQSNSQIMSYRYGVVTHSNGAPGNTTENRSGGKTNLPFVTTEPNAHLLTRHASGGLTGEVFDHWWVTFYESNGDQNAPQVTSLFDARWYPVGHPLRPT